MGWCCGLRQWRRDITSISFNAPLKPSQDWSACIHARLLGPCFKTGRIEYRSTDRRIFSQSLPTPPAVHQKSINPWVVWILGTQTGLINERPTDNHQTGGAVPTLQKQRLNSNVHVIRSVTKTGSQNQVWNLQEEPVAVKTRHWLGVWLAHLTGITRVGTHKYPSHISRGLSTGVVRKCTPRTHMVIVTYDATIQGQEESYPSTWWSWNAVKHSRQAYATSHGVQEKLNSPPSYTSWFYPFHYKRFHVLLNSLFKVLCNFPSRYLFAIDITIVFSLGRSLPPSLDCTLKQSDSIRGTSQ